MERDHSLFSPRLPSSRDPQKQRGPVWHWFHMGFWSLQYEGQRRDWGWVLLGWLHQGRQRRAHTRRAVGVRLPRGPLKVVASSCKRLPVPGGLCQGGSLSSREPSLILTELTEGNLGPTLESTMKRTVISSGKVKRLLYLMSFLPAWHPGGAWVSGRWGKVFKE